MKSANALATEEAGGFHPLYDGGFGVRSIREICAWLIVLTAFQTSPAAAIDLSDASVERLDNGLTLILLEDKTFPVVSIQTVYRTGAKDDPSGRLGLAHFFEHMAFRGSKNFPETGLVSEIYAAGGEWHGYTWIDLTTYFATTPKENLDLLLDIEADRMATARSSRGRSGGGARRGARRNERLRQRSRFQRCSTR